jgi:hypothetical protein
MFNSSLDIHDTFYSNFNSIIERNCNTSVVRPKSSAAAKIPCTLTAQGCYRDSYDSTGAERHRSKVEQSFTRDIKLSVHIKLFKYIQKQVIQYNIGTYTIYSEYKIHP